MNTRFAKWLLPVLMCLASVKAHAIELLWANKDEIKIVGQPCWQAHETLVDAGRIANSCACNPAVDFNLGTNGLISIIPAGQYSLFIRADSNPGSGTGGLPGVAVNGGGVVLVTNMPGTTPWRRLGVLDVPADTTNIVFTLQRDPVVTTCGVGTPEIPRTAPWPFYLYSVYMTTETNVVITANPELLQVWNYPTTTDTSPPVARNLLHNSSFEMPFPAGPWSVGFNSTRYWGLDETITTAEFQHGKSSMALHFDSCDGPEGPHVVRSRPVMVAPNKAHTLSVYAKSAGAGSSVRLKMWNPIAHPGGTFPAMPVYDSGAKTISSSWARYALTNQVLLEYPYAEYYVEIIATSPSRAPIYLDAVQLEEGPVATAFAPRDQKQLGILITQAGALLYDDEDPAVKVVFHNGTGADSTDTINWRIYEQGFKPSASGSVVVGSLAGGYYTNAISLPPLRYGFYRIEADLQAALNINCEADFTYARRPPSEPANNSLIGVHTHPYHFQQQVLQRAGFRHQRSLSPGAYFRWSFREPSDNAYSHVPTYVDIVQQYGNEIMGNLHQETPAWALRTFLTMTNQVGTYQLGETVTAGAASGIVTWISATNDPVPYPAMQVRNPSGTWSVGQTLVGGTSGATSTLSPKQKNTQNFENTVAFTANSMAVDQWRSYCSNIVAFYPSITLWEMLNEPGSGITTPTFNGDAGMAFSALFTREGVRGVRDVSATDKIISNAGHQGPVNATMFWDALPIETRTNMYGHSFHLYPDTLDGRGIECKAWCDARGLKYMNTETGYEDTSSALTYGSNRRYAGVAIDRYQGSEPDTRKHMKVPRMIATNIIETLWCGSERYYTFWASDRSDAGDELGTYGSHYTLQNIHGTWKSKAASIFWQNYILRQPTGVIVSNATYKVFGGIGITNSQWVAMYTGHNTNKVCTWSLTSAEYECYDFTGNLISGVASGKVPFSRQPTFVRGIGGVTVAMMSNAVTAAALGTSGSIVNAPDTVAPVVIITRCPVGIVTAQENASKISIGWVGYDDVATPYINDKYAIQYRYKFDSDPFTGWTGLCQLPPQSFAVGAHTFYVEVKDGAGNTNAAQKTFTIQ